MTAGPWTSTQPSTAFMWHRADAAGNLLCYVVEMTAGGPWSAYYGPTLTRRGCDDVTSAARCCNAGLRLLGFTCDDGVPNV